MTLSQCHPEEIKGLFRNCRLVGRRFRLAHIVFGRDVIEVAAFRGHHQTGNTKISKSNAQGRLLRNVCGIMMKMPSVVILPSMRCITTSATTAFAVLLDDFDKGLLIGDPETVIVKILRMIRAVRFAAN